MDPARIERYLQMCRDLIKEHGLMIQAVRIQPSLTYTIGLTATLGYELVVIGLPQEVAGGFLNDIATRLRKQKIEDGVPIADVATMPLMLRTQPVVDPATGDDLSEALTIAYHLGYAPTTFRQVLWPDPKGRFPGDPAYEFICSQNVAEVIGPQKTRH